MLDEAAAALIAPALGIAASPLPVAALIVMLLSARARLNGVVFAGGRAVGVAAVLAAVLLVPDLGDGAEAERVSAWVSLVLGLVLVGLGVVVAARRRRRATGADGPSWMARVDRMRPGTAFALGVAFSATNPKNTLLGVAAGVSLASADLSAGQDAAVIAVFTVVAASTVIAPVVVFLVGGHSLRARLAAVKDWLVRHDRSIIVVVALAVGTALVAEGVAGLAA